jgi:hypothetical protein
MAGVFIISSVTNSQSQCSYLLQRLLQILTEIHYRTLLWLTFNVTTEKQLAKGLEERAQQDVGRLYTLMRTCRK